MPESIVNGRKSVPKIRPTYQFNQLSRRAKARARRDYMRGWLESHPEDEDTVFDDSIISEDNCARFYRTGEYAESV